MPQYGEIQLTHRRFPGCIRSAVRRLGIVYYT
jgi:hypothetical protein